MNNPLFTGVCTALVTPFLHGHINYPMVQQLIKKQIDAGIHAVVMAGTTGEAPTLTDTEKLELFQSAKEYANNDCMIIAGTGSNCTEHAVALSKAAEKAGADALLVVSPYYNKTTPDGLYAHFLSIAHAVNIPIILYNVPSRTGVDIPVSVYKRLSSIPNIAGVKEASQNIIKVTQALSQCEPSFHVWSGNDELTIPIMALGGQGVISVTSNIYPEDVKFLCDAAIQGEYKVAAQIQQQLQPLNEVLFCEPNPIPVKTAMKLIGYDCGNCRPPLSNPNPDTELRLRQILQ